MGKRFTRALTPAFLLGAGVLLAANGPAVAPDETGKVAALDRFDGGDWEIRFRPDNGRRRLCLRNGRPLIQLRHPVRDCRQLVVNDTGDRVTVHYTCPGHGYGRTEIWRENGRLAQIQSQGIVDGEPFDFSAEARRVGSCRG